MRLPIRFRAPFRLSLPRLSPVYENSWTLLFGFLLLMMGNGVQGSLIAIRAGFEGFSDTTSGIVLSGYYLGMVISAFLTQGFVEKTGHVRVFAALSSVASAAVLLFFVVVSPPAWFVLRFVVGFCYTGLYIVGESWLNESVSNQFRGRLFSIYMAVQFVGFASGQLLLNLAPPSEATLFILISVLLSFAIVPMMLSARSSPPIPVPIRMKIITLYKISPFGTIAVPWVAATHTAFFTVGGYFGYKAGLTVAEISIMMFAVIVGGAVLQTPVGYVSDKVDRRYVVLSLAALVSILAVIAVLILAFVPKNLLIVLMFALCGTLSLPLFGNCVAHINDLAESGQAVAISGRIYLLSGFGCIIAPLLSAAFLGWFGSQGFFVFIAAMHVLLVLFTLYRFAMRGASGRDHTGRVPLLSRALGSVGLFGSYARLNEIRRRAIERRRERRAIITQKRQHRREERRKKRALFLGKKPHKT